MRPFRAIQLPSGAQEMLDVIKFDHIKADKRMGGDGCKQEH